MTIVMEQVLEAVGSPPTAAGVPHASTVRARVSQGMGWTARLLAGLVIVTMPWRQRVLLVERSRPPIYADFTDLSLYSHDILLLALLMVWGVSLFLQPRRLRFGPVFLWLPMAGLCAAALVSLLFSAESTLAVYPTVQLLSLALLFLFLINEITGVKQLLWAWAAQIAIQAAVALGQVWQRGDLGLELLGERDLSATAGAAMVWSQEGGHALRPYGLSDHPNILAINLALAFCLLLVWALPASGGWQLPSALLTAAAAVALLLTFSRAAQTALLMALLTMGVLFLRNKGKRGRRNSHLLVGVVTLLLLPVLWLNLSFLTFGSDSEAVSNRVQERVDSQIQRWTLNDAANQLFMENAIVGTGLGTLPVSLLSARPSFSYDYQPAPMALISAATELGALGGIFYLTLQLAPWMAMGLNWKRLRKTTALAGTSGALMAATLFSFSDAYLWFYPSGRLAQWLIWGLWGVAYLRAVSVGPHNLVTQDV